MEKYYDIFKNHHGYSSHKWEHYLFIYEQLFLRIREIGKPVTLLEIGVQNGGSLEIWEKYLPQNSKIYGIDIDKKCSDLKFSQNIMFHLGSALDSDFMNRTFKDIEFDVILDDGSHICKDVIATFINMFSKIKLGGMYIVEDLHTSYWKSYGGSFRKQDSSIEFFKGLADAINFDYIKKDRWINKKQFAILKAYNQMISSISFFDSICVINRYYQNKTEGFKSYITGEIETVSSNVLEIPRIKKQVELTEKMYGDQLNKTGGKYYVSPPQNTQTNN